MKRIISIIAAAATALVLLSGCGKDEETVTVKLGIMGASDYQIWEHVIEEFAEKNVIIEPVYFADFSLPNEALSSGEIDMNAFQHVTFLNSQVETYGYDFTVLGYTMLQAMNLYSDKITDLSEFKEGDTIAVPNDAVNFGRALTVIAAAGLIELDPEAGLTPEKIDIISNPLNLNILEVDASQTASLLPDVTAAIINGNYAIDAGLTINDALFNDDVRIYPGDAYFNTIVVRTEDADNELYKEIVEAYQSDATKEVFAVDFQGLYLAAWE